MPKNIMETIAEQPVFKYKHGDPEFLKDYHGTKVRYPFYDTLPEIEKFVADPRDVIITSFPKSGTTLISVIIHLIQNDADPTCLFAGPMEDTIEMMEMCAPNADPGTRPIDRINKCAPPRTCATHLGYDALPQSIRDVAKIVYVARNPKDTMVSLHNHFRAVVGAGFNGSLEDTAEDFFNSNRSFMPYFDHVVGYWKNREKPNVFFTTFERILKDFRNVTKDLAKFLEKKLTEEQLDVIAHHCSFDVMKNNENTNRTHQVKAKVLDSSISPFMRAGRIGNWKEHFTPELDERVSKWIAAEEKRLSDSLAGFHFEYE